MFMNVNMVSRSFPADVASNFLCAVYAVNLVALGINIGTDCVFSTHRRTFFVAVRRCYFINQAF
jgi:hypothetical protein